jgi:ATP-dependent DNA helicase RecQ
MDNYCRGAECRHASLVRYFGQEYQCDSCGACDVCLSETVIVPEADIISQKILSCVARVKERYGVGHVVSILRGENSENMKNRGHDQLSTYGLLSEHPAVNVREWIYQLISQEALRQEEIETSMGRMVPILRLTEKSWEVMRKQRNVRLLQPVASERMERTRKSKSKDVSADPAMDTLFQELRSLRRTLAQERKVPPYVVFSDATLHEFCKSRPSTLTAMRHIYGVGDTKLREFGEQFLTVIRAFCAEHAVPMDSN